MEPHVSGIQKSQAVMPKFSGPDIHHVKVPRPDPFLIDLKSLDPNGRLTTSLPLPPLKPIEDYRSKVFVHAWEL